MGQVWVGDYLLRPHPFNLIHTHISTAPENIWGPWKKNRWFDFYVNLIRFRSGRLPLSTWVKMRIPRERERGQAYSDRMAIVVCRFIHCPFCFLSFSQFFILCLSMFLVKFWEYSLPQVKSTWLLHIPFPWQCLFFAPLLYHEVWYWRPINR